MRRKASRSIVVGMLFLTLFFYNFQAEEKESTRQNNGKIIGLQQYSFNESPVIWIKTFGGRWADQCYAIETTTDGGFILVGDTTSFGSGSSDFWLVKVDKQGVEEWNQTYGGSRTDYAFDGHQTNDSGFILVGGTTSYGAGDDDVWLVKTDQHGTELWNRTFGGLEMDQGYAVKQVSNGGYIICGGTKSYGNGPNDYWVIRTDENGYELWNITYGTKGYDWGYDIIETFDHGFVFTGGTDTSLSGTHILDIGLIKLDPNGVLLWEKMFNKPFAKKRWDEGYGVLQTIDGGYMVAGIAHTYGWDEEGTGAGWIIKTDADGNKQWDQIYGGKNCDCFCSIQMADEGGYILSGWTYTYDAGKCDMWFMKTDSQGVDEWDMTLGEDKFEWTMLHTVQYTADHQYMLGGTTQSIGSGGSDMMLVKLRDPSITITRNHGLGWTIQNTGAEDVQNLNWSIRIDGEMFMGIEKSGTILLLPAGGEISIEIGRLMLVGFGPVTIRVIVGCIGKTLNCFLLGPFIMGV